MHVRASKEQGPHESFTNFSGHLSPCVPSNIEIQLIQVDPMLQFSECFMVCVHARYEHNICACKAATYDSSNSVSVSQARSVGLNMSRSLHVPLATVAQFFCQDS